LSGNLKTTSEKADANATGIADLSAKVFVNSGNVNDRLNAVGATATTAESKADANAIAIASLTATTTALRTDLDATAAKADANKTDIANLSAQLNNAGGIVQDVTAISDDVAALNNNAVLKS